MSHCTLLPPSPPHNWRHLFFGPPNLYASNELFNASKRHLDEFQVGFSLAMLLILDIHTAEIYLINYSPVSPEDLMESTSSFSNITWARRIKCTVVNFWTGFCRRKNGLFGNSTENTVKRTFLIVFSSIYQSENTMYIFNLCLVLSILKLSAWFQKEETVTNTEGGSQ